MDKIDWTLWLQVGNFLLLIVILQRLLYRPLLAILDQRQIRQDNAVQRSRDLEAQIAQQQDAFDAQLSQAKLQAQQARSAALEQAQKQQALLIGEAHDQAMATLEQVRREVAGQLAVEAGQLQSYAARLGDDVAERLLGRPL